MNELQAPMKYKGTIVATTKIAAEYLQVNESTLSNRFTENKDNFNENEHYFYIEHKEMVENSQTPVTGIREYSGNRGIRVFTQKGLLRLTRFLRSDVADILFQEMEDSYFKSKAQIPKQLTEIQLAENYLKALVANQNLALERDIAIETKAEIGNRREATSMNTASQAVKKANKLEVELDLSKEYCTIKRMEMINHGQKFSWRVLKSAQKEMNGNESIDVFDANYGTVKAYHVAVWEEAYGITLD